MGKAMKKLIEEIKARRNKIPAGHDLFGDDFEVYPTSPYSAGVVSPLDLTSGESQSSRRGFQEATE